MYNVICVFSSLIICFIGVFFPLWLICLPLCFPWLPVVLCAVLRLQGLSPVHFSRFIVKVLIKFRQSRWWDFMDIFLITLGDTISEQSPSVSGSYNLSTLSSTISLSLRFRCWFINVSHKESWTKPNLPLVRFPSKRVNTRRTITL